jgi:hypothetical protein
MKTISGTTINSFLSGVINPAEVLSRYSGTMQVYRYIGYHRFYRAAGLIAAGGMAHAYEGGWWADESVLIEIAQKLERAKYWMTRPEKERAWPTHYRALVALSFDWNDMSEMFLLELPVGEEIEGLAGSAREQPEFSICDPHGRHNPNRILVGQAEQVFFKVKNPLWIRKVNLF